jgi:hypothetical protein
VPNAVGLGLARNRRGPKRPSEPRPSGVHPEEGAVEKDAKHNSYIWSGSCSGRGHGHAQVGEGKAPNVIVEACRRRLRESQQHIDEIAFIQEAHLD